MKTVEIAIGPNGSGKSKWLKNEKEKISKKGDFCFFLETETELKNELVTKINTERFKNNAEDLIKKIISFKYNLNKEEKLKIQKKEEKIKKILKTKINEIFDKNDVDEITGWDDLLQQKDYKNYENIFPLLQLKKLDSKNNIGGSGQKFYNFLKLVWLLNEVHNEFEKNENIYILIDEPEKFSHPNLIKKIARILGKIAINFHLRIVTHSAFFLNCFYNSFEKKERNNLKFKKFNFNGKNSKKNENEKTFILKNFVQEIENSESLPNSVKNDQIIDFPHFRIKIFNSLFAEKIILVEDKAQKILLSLIIEEIEKENIVKNYFLFECYGKRQMPYACGFFKNKLKIDFFVTFDRDKDIKNHEKINNWLEKYIDTKKYFIFEDNIEKAFHDGKKDPKTLPFWILKSKIKDDKNFKDLKKLLEEFLIDK